MKPIKFIKPSITKIILTIILFLLISQTATSFNVQFDSTPKFGFPLGFYSYQSHSFGKELSSPITFFSATSLILNLIFYYIISCLLILTYKKMFYKK